MKKTEEGARVFVEASLKAISVKQVWDIGDLNEHSDWNYWEVAGLESQNWKCF